MSYSSQYKAKTLHFVYYLASLALGVALGLFIYNTVIVPEPYKKDLARCLETAKLQQDDIAAALCHETYGGVR